MKQLLTIVFIGLVFGGCNSNDAEVEELKKEVEQLKSKKNQIVDKTIKLGSSYISLPMLDGMHECYDDYNVKQTINFITAKNNCEILAVYLNDFTYARKENLGYNEFDDYFTVWIMNNIKELDAGKKEFLMLEKENRKQFSDDDFINDLKDYKNLKEDIFSNLKMGEIYVVDVYKFNEESITSIMLSSINNRKIIIVINIALLNKRILNYGYYYEFDGYKSIEKAKNKNDMFTKSLFELNTN